MTFKYKTVAGELKSNMEVEIKIEYFVNEDGDVLPGLLTSTALFKLIHNGELLHNNICRAAKEDYLKNKTAALPAA